MKPPIIGTAMQNPLFTGRLLLILKEGDYNKGKIQRALASKWGFKVANSADFTTEPINENSIKEADVFFYDELGVALIGCEDERNELLASVGENFYIEPEKVVYIPDEIPITGENPSIWGLEATRAINSSYNGNGVRVAVLDTGIDTEHPDYEGRDMITESFVPDETVQDLHGHGTHCIGTACGSTDINGARYGVATEAQVWAGKVLNNRGSGAQAWVLNGITWAANNNCNVISMSLGSRVTVGQSHDVAYERAAQYAVSKGAVIVAAAGNDSRRAEGVFSPVSSPADCPSILAVAAIDPALNVAGFSNRAINPAGLVDIAAPGVDIYSSWPMPGRYRTISGTSMATPHVAGILALLFEKYPNSTPGEITEKLYSIAKALPLPDEDVGAGLSIAP